MELASDACRPYPLQPLWTQLTRRLARIYRGKVPVEARSTLSHETPESPVFVGRVTERSKEAAHSNSDSIRGRPAQHSVSRRGRPKPGITIVALALDVYNARVYHDMLEARGYRAVVAHRLESWLDVLAGCDPDLILIDLCSADHPSTGVARAIMRDARFASVPVIAVTDAHQSGDLSDPLRLIADCDGRIFKPVSVKAFYGPIESSLHCAAVRRRFRQ